MKSAKLSAVEKGNLQSQ